MTAHLVQVLGSLRGWHLVDLVVGVLVVLAVARALQRRRGVLGAAGAALGTLVVSWLVLVAVAVWGPASLAGPVSDSQVVRVVGVPHHAIDQAASLIERLLPGHEGPATRP